jgi:hypothetical protein
MWPLSRSTEHIDAQAKIVAPILMGCCEQTAPIFLKALVGEKKAGSNQGLIAPLTIELLVFALHLTDRITFARLGPSKRAKFMNALLPGVQRELKPPLDSQLQRLYNTRNTFYGGFPKLFPDKKDNLKGTLFWEFGKAMGSVYAENNPVAIAQTAMDGMDFMVTVNQVLATAKVV